MCVFQPCFPPQFKLLISLSRSAGPGAGEPQHFPPVLLCCVFWAVFGVCRGSALVSLQTDGSLSQWSPALESSGRAKMGGERKRRVMSLRANQSTVRENRIKETGTNVNALKIDQTVVQK